MSLPNQRQPNQPPPGMPVTYQPQPEDGLPQLSSRWRAYASPVLAASQAVRAIISVVVLIVVVVFGIRFFHLVNGFSSSNNGLAVEDNVSRLANAENVYRANHPLYTNAVGDLAASGYQPSTSSSAEVLLLGATAGSYYCVIGGATASTGTWYLYNSSQATISSLDAFTTYDSWALAEQACPMNYQQVSGAALF